MSIAREKNKHLDIVRRKRLLIHIIENYKIGKILFDTVWTARIDYLVREKTNTSYLVRKTFVREICEEVYFDKIKFGIKVLEPALYIGCKPIVVFERNIPMLIIDKRGGLWERALNSGFLCSISFEQTQYKYNLLSVRISLY